MNVRLNKIQVHYLWRDSLSPTNTNLLKLVKTGRAVVSGIRTNFVTFLLRQHHALIPFPGVLILHRETFESPKEKCPLLKI